NGETVQTYHTGAMMFKIDVLIARILEVYDWKELPTGTLIYTGVGPGIGFNVKEPEKSRPSLKAGDEVIVKLPFGQLRNRLINKQ
ncbi:MAG: fumarylacetoacetate hydrolase family protein, partial [candidate division KSB1 bacterium]|nr:fumarylacetoacetate hydrolase family protein [candidate division KSB1 bacterium]